MTKIHICEICNEEFTKPRINHPSRFCSRGCFFAYQRSDEAKEISRQKMTERREKYLKKHGTPLGFSSINNPSKSSEARKKLSDLRRGTSSSLATRKKQSESMKATLRQPEMRKKWSEAATGRKLDFNTKKKISEAHKNKFKSRAGLIQKLDKIYSRYIRESSAVNGVASCITCDRTFDISNMDCGHYISRRFLSLRWDERNTKPQCVRCNRFEQGNIDVYTTKMVDMYGPSILSELNAVKNSNTKITTASIEEKLYYYSKKLKELNPTHYPYL